MYVMLVLRDHLRGSAIRLWLVTLVLIFITLFSHLRSGVLADSLGNKFNKGTRGTTRHAATQILEIHPVGDHHIGSILKKPVK